VLKFFGYAGAILVGLTLGLTGGGGSILTVPILVYILDISPVTATAYSLFIVGTTSLIGAIEYFRQGLVNLSAGLVFAVPAQVGVFTARRFILPALPDPICQMGDVTLTKDVAILILFALLMILAAVSMIRGRTEHQTPIKQHPLIYLQIWLQGFGVGTLTGLVGAGGGFLIVPSLVMLVRLPMLVAVGTSLMIITINAMIGFSGDLLNRMPIDWFFLFSFTLLAIIGVVTGSYLARFISERKLKVAFGWFVLVAGIYILSHEFIESLN